MRLDRLFFTVIAVPIDFAAVVAAGLVAWALRLSESVRALRPIAFDIRFQEYFTFVFLAAGFTVFMLAVAGLYRFPRAEVGPFRLTLRILLATSATLAAVALAIFLRQELFGSRFLVLAGWSLATAFLVFERGVFVGVERWLARRYGIGLRRALVIGADGLTDRVVAALTRDVTAGIRVVRRTPDPDVGAVGAALEADALDAIVLADPNYPRERVTDLVDLAHERHVAFIFVPNLFQTLTANARVGLVGDIPVVELRRTRLDGWGRVVKRVVDIAGAALALLLFGPTMLLIAAAVKVDDAEGPMIYRNRRAGERGKPFWTLKFRSMAWKYATGSGAPNPEWAIQFERKLAEEQSVRRGPVWKILNDPRRTRVGRFLERTSLDELPQFFNVLKGEMSLVGPRPHMVEQVEQYERRHKHVLAIKPGVTGLAQISGRSDLDFDDEVRLDLYYLEHWSPWLDFKIIFLTPFAVLFRKHRS